MLVMTKPRSPKTVCICVFFCVFGIGDFAGSSVRKIYIFHLVAKSPLLVCLLQRLLLSSSFQQNWFHVFWTSFAKDISFPVCEIEVDPFPFGVYNILLDYDVSLHILVVLVVTIPTSPRLSKTESICKSYGVLILLLDLPGDGLESPVTPESPVQRTRSLRPLCFAAKCVAVVRYWTGVRRYPGDGPEFPAHRSLRSKGPGISDPRCFSALLRFCGAVLDRCPEHPRRVSGVSGPRDRSLRPCPDDPATRRLPECPAQTGVSGHLHRSLRPEKAPTASFWGGGYKKPPSYPKPGCWSCSLVFLSLPLLLTL